MFRYLEEFRKKGIVIADLCAMDGTSCFVSVSVRAEAGGRLESRGFDNVEVSGDSLVVMANFQTLR